MEEWGDVWTATVMTLFDHLLSLEEDLRLHTAWRGHVVVEMSSLTQL